MGNGTAVHAYTDRRNPQHKQIYVHICILTLKNNMNRRDARILGLACEQAHFHTFSFLSQLALRPTATFLIFTRFMFFLLCV